MEILEIIGESRERNLNPIQIIINSIETVLKALLLKHPITYKINKFRNILLSYISISY